MNEIRYRVGHETKKITYAFRLDFPVDECTCQTGTSI